MTETEKQLVGMLYTKYEASTYRYMEAENLLIDIMEMNPIKRFFLTKKISKFLMQQSNKYDAILADKGKL
jgi:hypothetical protein